MEFVVGLIEVTPFVCLFCVFVVLVGLWGWIDGLQYMIFPFDPFFFPVVLVAFCNAYGDMVILLGLFYAVGRDMREKYQWGGRKP